MDRPRLRGINGGYPGFQLAALHALRDGGGALRQGGWPVEQAAHQFVRLAFAATRGEPRRRDIGLAALPFFVLNNLNRVGHSTRSVGDSVQAGGVGDAFVVAFETSFAAGAVNDSRCWLTHRSVRHLRVRERQGWRTNRHHRRRRGGRCGCRDATPQAPTQQGGDHYYG